MEKKQVRYLKFNQKQSKSRCSSEMNNQTCCQIHQISILGSVFLQPCYLIVQAVEKLVQGAESGCPTEREKQVILNSTQILTRILPYIFEDQDWRGFFWSTVPGAGRAGVSVCRT